MNNDLKQRFFSTNSYIVLLMFSLLNIVFFSKLKGQESKFTKMSVYHFTSDSLFEKRESLDLSEFLRWEKEYDDKGKLIETKNENARLTTDDGRQLEITDFFDQNNLLYQYTVFDIKEKSIKTFRINEIKDTLIFSIRDTIFYNDSLVITQSIYFENGDTASIHKVRQDRKKGELKERIEVWDKNRGKKDILNISLWEVYSDFFSTAKYINIQNGDTVRIATGIYMKDPDGHETSIDIRTSNKGGYYSMRKNVRVGYNDKFLRADEYYFDDGKWNLLSTETREYDEFERKLVERKIRKGGQPSINYYRYE